MSMQQENSGFVSFTAIVLLICLLGLVQFIFFRSGDETPRANLPTPEMANQETPAQPITMLRKMSLTPVNNYDGRGTVTIDQPGGQHYEVNVTAALPNEFETTYYEAFLSNDVTTLALGKLTKENGQHRLMFRTFQKLDEFTTLEIIVDGDATTVEGLALPHTVMQGSF